MDTFREAVDALVSARKTYGGMTIEITLETYGARIHATLDNYGMGRSVSWEAMEHAHANVLAICVGVVARQLAASRSP